SAEPSVNRFSALLVCSARRNKGGSQLAGSGLTCLAGNLVFPFRTVRQTDQRRFLTVVCFKTERRAQMLATGNEMFVISVDIDSTGKVTERIPDLEKSAQLHNTLL